MTVGADFLNDYLTTYQFEDNESKNQNSCDAFAQFDYNPLQWLNIVASLRHDYFSASSQHATTGRLALMTKWKGFSIRANYAGGFRAPTLKEMYMNFDMAGMQMIYGNPDLKPEKSNNYNLALEHTGRVKNAGFFTGQYSLTLMGYYNKYDKRITTEDCADYTPGTGQPDVASRYCNEDGVEVSGIDFSAQYRSDMGLGVKLDYSYLHVGGRSVDSSSPSLVRIQLPGVSTTTVSSVRSIASMPLCQADTCLLLIRTSRSMTAVISCGSSRFSSDSWMPSI